MDDGDRKTAATAGTVTAARIDDQQNNTGTQEATSPTPSSADRVESFLALFNGYEKAYGTYANVKAVAAGEKATGNALTHRGKTPRAIVEGHLDGTGAGLGIVPLREDDTCWFGAIDIDIQGKIVLREELPALEKRIEALKLPLVVCRSKSGGAHCYVFFKEPTPAIIVITLLQRWSSMLGYGGCEVFPKQTSRANEDDVGNWINLPYYGGDETTRYAIRDGKQNSLEEFLAFAKSRRADGDALLSAETPADDSPFADGPPCLQTLARDGLPEGTRDDALLNMGVYFKQKYPDDWEEWLRDANDRFADPRLSRKQVDKIAKSLSRKDYHYGCKKQPLCGACNKALCLTREFGVGAGDAQGIVTHRRQLRDVVSEAWEALVGSNRDYPLVFKFGDTLVRVEADAKGAPIVKVLTPDRLSYQLARVSDWFKSLRPPIPTSPPREVVNDMLATPGQWNPLPELRGIASSPVMAPDGSVRAAKGYDAVTRLFFDPRIASVPAVPDQPTSGDVQAAVALIMIDMLGDFPFESDADRANAFALVILAFARLLIDGPTPLHLIGKPSPGTGATLLCEVIAAMFLGRPLEMKSPPGSEEEWRKFLTATLADAPTFVAIDNLNDLVRSAALASVLTADAWQDRVLGQSRTISVPVGAVFVATGNNPQLSAEIARRTVRIRLNAKVERPWERKEFRHKNLRKWSKENRGRLIAAVLTILRSWIVAERPTVDGPGLGSYEEWSEVVGGVLANAGVSGFLQNQEQLYEEADPETNTKRLLIHCWINAPRYRDAECEAAELLGLVEDHNLPIPLAPGTSRSQAISFGKYLGNMREQRFSFPKDGAPLTVELRKRDVNGKAKWRLALVEGAWPGAVAQRDEAPPF